jgi:hypothetical protein
MGPAGGHDALPRTGENNRLALALLRAFSMATIHKQDGTHLVSFQTGEVVARGAMLAISCVISYWLITHILASTYSISGMTTS